MSGQFLKSNHPNHGNSHLVKDHLNLFRFPNQIVGFDYFFDEEVYEALSWVGLKNTISWNNLNEQDQNNFNQIRVNFLIANENCE